ncbi:hypothetical protein M569_13537, partial [Genlisea aurea]
IVANISSDVNNTAFESLRMNRDTFGRLCTILKSRGLVDSKYVRVPEKVAIFLGVLAHHTKVRMQKRDFDRSTWTISKHFNCVLRATVAL